MHNQIAKKIKLPCDDPIFKLLSPCCLDAYKSRSFVLPEFYLLGDQFNDWKHANFMISCLQIICCYLRGCVIFCNYKQAILIRFVFFYFRWKSEFSNYSKGAPFLKRNIQMHFPPNVLCRVHWSSSLILSWLFNVNCNTTDGWKNIHGPSNQLP